MSRPITPYSKDILPEGFVYPEKYLQLGCEITISCAVNLEFSE
jgi:hypothetical protein